jgi:hypothetical protein
VRFSSGIHSGAAARDLRGKKEAHLSTPSALRSMLESWSQVALVFAHLVTKGVHANPIHAPACVPKCGLTIRSSGRPKGRRLPQTLGASNAGERRTANGPSSSWRWCGFMACTVTFGWPRVLRRSAHSVSSVTLNLHRWCGPSVLRRPAHGFSRFAVRCAWRIGCLSTRAVYQGCAGSLSCVVCAGASFIGSVPKCSGVACKARAQSRAARAAVTGFVQSEQPLLNRRWQTHGRECQSVQQVRLSQRST